MANFPNGDLQTHQGVFFAGLPDVYVNLVYGSQVGASGIEPIWALVSPPNLSTIAPTDRVVVRVTVPGASIGPVFVSFIYATLGLRELAFRVDAGVAPYSDAIVTPITGGLEISFLRSGGWPDTGMALDGIGFDDHSTEGDGAFSWTVEFASTPAGAVDDLAVEEEGTIGRDILVDPVTRRFALTASGDLAMVSGAESIAQAVRQKLKLFLGEYYLDETQGMDWWNTVLVKNPNLAAVRTLIRSAIEEVPGIRAVITFNLDFAAATRQLGVEFKASTDTGELIVSSFSLAQGAQVAA